MVLGHVKLSQRSVQEVCVGHVCSLHELYMGRVQGVRGVCGAFTGHVRDVRRASCTG